MRNIITTDVLKTMIPDELEDYRSCGEYFRQELTHAVLRDLNSPKEWNINVEHHSEFGGFFPVQVRLTPSHGRFQLAVCSPGDVSPVWMVMFITASDYLFSVVNTMPMFNPGLINKIINQVACLDADGYSVDSLISILMVKKIK